MENLKKAVGEAGTFLTRAVQDAHISDEATTILNRAKQFTEEKLGKAERTENDPYFESLCRRSDKIKLYTEKLVRDGEAVLVPNPAARLESFMFETIPVDKIGVTNKRLTNLEYLGQDMIESGNEFGVGTPYGSALIRVGQTEQALGEIEREFIRRGHEAMMGPLQNFLDGEMRNIMREKKSLENKRLDLDSFKNKVRKARSMQLQTPKEGVDPRVLLEQAETELRIAQSEYDKQLEITRLLMEGLSAIQTNHLRHLKNFVEAQSRFYSNCYQIMQDLQKELVNTMAIAAPMDPSMPIIRSTLPGHEDSASPLRAVDPYAGFPPPPPDLSMPYGADSSQNGGRTGDLMHQISLSSPPPPAPPAPPTITTTSAQPDFFRNAEFF